MRPRTSPKCATQTEVAFLRPARSGIQQTAPRHSLATEVLLCHEQREHAAAGAILLRVRSNSRPRSDLKNLSRSTTGVARRVANSGAFSRNVFKKRKRGANVQRPGAVATPEKSHQELRNEE
ncbi:unnamed protein product [Ixodes pacificus]